MLNRHLTLRAVTALVMVLDLLPRLGLNLPFSCLGAQAVEITGMQRLPS